MRPSLIAITAIAAVLVSQAACAKEPSQEPAAAAQDQASRLPERDDARPLTAFSRADPADAGTCSRDPRAALDGAVSMTIGAIRGNDAEAFLNLIGSDGLDINGTVSRDGLAKQFAARSGRFCDLFACGGRVGDMHAKFHDGPTDIQYDAKNGRAAVFINANTNDELDLSYKWSNSCRWELTAIAVP